MSSQKNDLIQEGSVSFWIKIKDNPQFKDRDSNINFMLNKDFGGVTLTILKEKENLIVEVDNKSYGRTRITQNILGYLNKDMMVALTWKEYSLKLYLNGELIQEEILEKGKGMIQVKIGKELNNLLELTDVTYDDVYHTINDRHKGILIPGNPLRIGAIHWFNGKIVFVTSSVSKYKTIGNTLKFEEVVANLILRLRDDLPAGKIDKNMDFLNILHVVSESFGLPVKTTIDGQPKLLHTEGEWDGTISFKSEGNEDILLQGTFSQDDNKCHYVWAFSLEKYRNWIDNLNFNR